MSLAIALICPNCLCIAADTRAVEQDGDTLTPNEETTVEKVRIVTRCNGKALVALAGRSELLNKPLLDHAEEKWTYLFSTDGIKDFVAYLKTTWQRDIEEYPYDNPADRDEFIKDERFSILIANSPDHFYLIDGSYPNIESRRMNLGPFLASISRRASKEVKAIAPPIDVAILTNDNAILDRMELDQLRKWSPKI